MTKTIGPEPGPPRSPTKSRVLTGIASMISVVLLSRSLRRYWSPKSSTDTTAPGIAFGVVVPLTDRKYEKHALSDGECRHATVNVAFAATVLLPPLVVNAPTGMSFV